MSGEARTQVFYEVEDGFLPGIVWIEKKEIQDLGNVPEMIFLAKQECVGSLGKGYPNLGPLEINGEEKVRGPRAHGALLPVYMRQGRAYNISKAGWALCKDLQLTISEYLELFSIQPSPIGCYAEIGEIEVRSKFFSSFEKYQVEEEEQEFPKGFLHKMLMKRQVKLKTRKQKTSQEWPQDEEVGSCPILAPQVVVKKRKVKLPNWQKKRADNKLEQLIVGCVPSIVEISSQFSFVDEMVTQVQGMLSDVTDKALCGPKIQGLIESVRSALVDHGNELGELRKGMENFSLKLGDKEMGSLTEFISFLKDPKISLKTSNISSSILERVIGVLLVIILILCSPNIWFAIGLAGATCFFSGSFSALGAWLSRNKKDLDTLATGSSVQLEGSAVNGDLLPVITKIIASGLAFAVSSEDERKLPQYLKAGNWAASCKNIVSLGDLIKEGCVQATSILWQMHTGLPLKYKDNMEVLEILDNINEIFEKTLMNADWVADLPTSRTQQDFLDEYHKKLLRFNTSLLIDGKETQIVRALQPILQYVVMLKKNVVALRKPFKERPTPTFVVFQGPTGVGKTDTTKRLVLDVFRCMPIWYKEQFKKIEDLIFAKTPGESFFEGYNSNFAMWFDELFSLPAESEQTKEEAALLLGLISTCDAPLKAATCEIKSKLVPTSPLVVATTNLVRWEDIPMTCVEALKRRRHFFCLPIVKPQFANGDTSLNVDVWLQHCEANQLDPTKPDFAIYRLFNMDDERIGDVDYDELVRRVQRHVLRNLSKANDRQTVLSQAFDIFRQEAYEVQGDSMNEQEVLAWTESQFLELLVGDGIRALEIYRLLSDNEKKKITNDIVKQSIKGRNSGGLDFGFSWNQFDIRVLQDKYFRKSEKPRATDSENLCESMRDMISAIPTIGLGKSTKAWTLTEFKEYLKPGVTGFESDYLRLSEDERKQVAGKIVLSMETSRLTTELIHRISPKLKLEDFNVELMKEHYGTLSKFWVFSALKRISADILDKVKNNPYKVIAGVIFTIVSIVGLAYNLYNRTRVDGKMVHRQVNKLNQAKIQKESEIPSYTQKFQSRNNRRIRTEGMSDPNLESIRLKIRGNIKRVTTFIDTKQHQRAICLAVASDYVLLNKHIIQTESGCKVDNICIGEKFKISFDKIVVHELGEIWCYDDVVLLQLPSGSLPVASIVKHFISYEDVPNLMDCYGEVLVRRNIDDGAEIQIFGSNIEIVEFAKPLLVGPVSVALALQYNVPTIKGDCGSPILRRGSQYNGKIIGIHGLGKVHLDEGMGAIVHKEWLEQVISKTSKVVLHGEDLEPCVEDPGYFSDGQIVIGRTHNVLGFSSKNKIIASPLVPYLPWNSTSKPTECTMNNVALAFTKYRDNICDWDQALIGTLEKFCTFKLLGGLNKVGQILSWEQSLNCFKSLTSINMNSSANIPFVFDKVKKTDLVTYDGNAYYFKDENFLSALIKYEEKIKLGIAEEPIWAVYPKSERLPIEKVEKGKLRLFAGSPFNFTLLCRRYFGDFLAHIRSFGHVIGVQVGLDVHQDWGKLAKWLTENGDMVLFIDWSSWDKTVMNCFLEVFFHLADVFYGTSNSEIRKWIQEVILSPTYQIKNIRFKTRGGNPSGCVFTAELNSIANLICLMYLYVKIGCTLDQVFSLRIATWGDDAVISANFEYSPQELVFEARDLGMTLTAGDKSDVLDFKSIYDGRFLGRLFKRDKYEWLCPLKFETLTDALLWVNGNENVNEAVQSTIRSILIEARYLSNMGLFYWYVIKAASRTGFEIDYTELMLEQMQNVTLMEGSIDGTILQSILISMSNLIWTSLPNFSTSVREFSKIYWARIVAIDLSTKMPFLPSNIFFHIGFKINGVEYTFGNRGLQVCNWEYEPTLDVNITPECRIGECKLFSIFLEEAQHGYHLTMNNCMHWVERVCSKIDIVCPVNSKKCMEWLRDNQAWMLQGDDDTLLSSLGQNVVSESTTREAARYVRIGNACTRTLQQTIETSALLGSTTWDTTMDIGSELFSLDLPQDMFIIDQFAAKLKYNYLVNCDIEITLKCKPTKFQQGKLMMVFIPQYDRGWAGDVGPTLEGMTCLPGPHFNVSQMNECKLTIPYIHVLNALKLVNGAQLAVVKVLILNPLKPAIAGGINVRILGRLLNFKTQIPTPLRSFNYAKGKVVGTVGPTYYVQGQDEAEEKSASGLITTIGEVAGQLGTTLNGLPIIGDVLKGVRVVSQVVSPVLQLFGFSKPISIETTKPIIPRIFSGVGQAEGLDTSTVLGVNPRNSVVINPAMFGTKLDEMSIDVMIRTPMLLTRVNWLASDGQDKTLFSAPVTPLLHNSDGGSIQMSPMGYVAMIFNYWRGPIDFTFEVVGTPWHKGILAAYFIPGAGNVFEELEVEMEVTSVKLLDLTEKQLMVVRCDFTSPRIYHKVGEVNRQPINADAAVGSINLKIFNKLVAPSTVAQSVQVNVWVAAGENFHFAFPTMNRISAITMGPKPNTLNDFVMFGEEDELSGVMSNQQYFKQAETFDCMPKDSQSYEDVCMGEEVKSLRSILKIASRKWSFSGMVGPQGAFVIPAHRFKDIKEGKISLSIYDYIIRLFRFARGSVRQKIALVGSDVYLTATHTIDEEGAFEIIPYRKDVEGAPWMATVSDINPTLEIVLPYYHYEKLLVLGKDLDSRSTLVQFLMPKKANVSIDVSEAIGEDFSAGFFMYPQVFHFAPMVASFIKAFAILNDLKEDELETYQTRFSYQNEGLPWEASYTTQTAYIDRDTAPLVVKFGQKAYYIHAGEFLIAFRKPKALPSHTEIASLPPTGKRFSILFTLGGKFYADKGSCSYNWNETKSAPGGWFVAIGTATETSIGLVDQVTGHYGDCWVPKDIGIAWPITEHWREVFAEYKVRFRGNLHLQF